MNQTVIEELLWEKARDEITAVSPDFAHIIDDIAPSNELTFIKVRYPFGAKIVDNGVLNIPTERGNLRPVTDPQLPKFFRERLNYSLVPLGLIVKNSIEVYRELDDRVFSVASWAQGLDLGIWEHFGWTTPYSITAGARSLYMIPRVTLSSAHKKLKRDYNVTLPPPKRTCDHWKLFCQIANSPSFSDPWSCDVIYLSNTWIEKLRQYEHEKNGAWARLHHFLVHKNLQHSEYGRRRSIFEIIWELFSRTLSMKGLRPNPYVIDTLKHLTFIGTGGSPGSVPNTGTTILGPIPALQMVYIDSYGLKEYVPTIMQPQYLRADVSEPIYYSLQSPTLLESIPKSRNLTSIIDNVRDLKELAEHFLGEAFDEHLKIANTPINKIISRLQFELFHEAAYAYGTGILPSTEMPKKDPSLTYSPKLKAGGKFADTSPYLHGCVRISLKENSD